MTKPVKKAIIAAAGYGTRMLPATKTMPKEMLPIINKPILQIIVEELADSGIEQIALVTGWRNEPTDIENYFDTEYNPDSKLDQKLVDSLNERAKKLMALGEEIDFTYIRQEKRYGNGVPIISAEEFIEDDPFIYAFGDDLVHSSTPFSQSLIESYEEANASVLGVQPVSKEEVSSYGIVEADTQNGLKKVNNIIEKPKPEETDSRLASFGRYLFESDIINYLKNTSEGKDGELWLADGVQNMLEGKEVVAQEVEDGQWLTTGDPINYLTAQVEYALDSEVGGEFLSYLKERVSNA